MEWGEVKCSVGKEGGRVFMEKFIVVESDEK